MARRAQSAPPLSSAQIRQGFLDFFAARGHTVVPSAPLVPAGDATLLFTNSGMVQFKDIFLGKGSRPYVRAVDSQKCLRVAGKHNDLDDVGRDGTHHTFFEMLGNWSFGDYYKAEAIPWAWELLTQVWGLPPERMWAACFEDEKGQIPRDDEAAEIWRGQKGFDSSHVLFFGRKENFWEMADTGPCGPDSEVHFDRGPAACDKAHLAGHICRVNGDCARFVEIWNLVFIQYNRTGPTDLSPLPRKHVDTGMGFERLVSVIQGVDSNYKTDLFLPLIARVQERSGAPPDRPEADPTPFRVIADHARAAAFLIADGVVPGNLSRNYVCRMIIRRASRFGSQLGIRGPFLSEIARVVIDEYSGAYPELARNQDSIARWLTDEEERFARTVDSGVARALELVNTTRKRGGSTLPGALAFDLYSSYGLPLEITRDIAREQGLEVEEAGFQAAFEAHRLSSSGANAEAGVAEEDAAFPALAQSLRAAGTLSAEGVDHDPYNGLAAEGEVLALVEDGKSVEHAGAGSEVAVVLPRSPFYLAGGGQVTDTGVIRGEDGSAWEIAVQNVERPTAGLLIHRGRVSRGSPKVGDRAQAVVDEARRWDIMRNHTATHLLHASLRKVLGDHARQAGSLVAPDRLRFDFTHPSAVSPEELWDIENLVNEAILLNHPVEVRTLPLTVATAEGATALFGEAYGETVRTIRIGGENWFSYELCGGTHVPNTGVIVPFFITSEASAAAGIRRIEAVTGREAVHRAQHALRSLPSILRRLGTSAEPEARIEALLRIEKEYRQLSAAQRSGEAKAHLDRITPTPIRGVPVFIVSLPEVAAASLRGLVDDLRSQHPSFAAVLGSAPDGEPLVITSVSKDLVARGLHAGKMAEAAAQAMGGGGGGSPTLGQAGGKESARLDQALAGARSWIESNLR